MAEISRIGSGTITLTLTAHEARGVGNFMQRAAPFVADGTVGPENERPSTNPAAAAQELYRLGADLERIAR